MIPLLISLCLLFDPSDLPGWPELVAEIQIESTQDGADQPALFYVPPTDEPIPLLVGLHTWSGNYKQTNDSYGAPYAQWCIERGWAFVYPNFRGPNRRPEATGSELVVQDVLDAVAEMDRRANIDPERIVLVGVSGGGHLALLLAGRHPDRWAAVSAWVPISDLAAWHGETKAAGHRYWIDLEASCGGAPGASDEVDAEYRKRSPLTHLPNAAGKLPIAINAGIRDGHSGSVPISHSIRAFNVLAESEDRISEEHVRELVQTATVPAGLSKSWTPHLENGRRILFRRRSGPARLTLFDGGHEIVTRAALEWLAAQIEDVR